MSIASTIRRSRRRCAIASARRAGGSSRGRTRIFKRDAVPFTEQLHPASYDITFADPPYESKVLDRIIGAWRELKYSRVLAVEHATAHALPPGGQRRLCGDSSITVYTV